MNSEGFNTANINASIVDVTSRSAVFGAAYANGSVSGRMRARMMADPLVYANGALLDRKMVRGINVFAAQANRTGVDRAGLRALINAQAQAQTVHSSTRVLLRLSASASANTLVLLRGLRNSPASSTASAQAAPTGRKAVRSYMESAALAQATPLSRLWARSPALVNAQAVPVITPRALRRSAAVALAQAAGFVGGHTTIFYPFDEPAQEEYTFLLGFEDNIFYVR